MSEFDRSPVAARALKPARYFAASYAGEHVAGTEFVIGAMFVAWGVGAVDIILGLLVGNTLAVLTWALICAPVATDTRLTLYAYLERIAGPAFIKVYSVVNGILMCVLAGAMITVSASAVRILFDIPPQIEWYPTDWRFVIVALTVGAVVAFAAMRGFAFVARFAQVSAPWLISMFFVGAIAILSVLVAGTPGVDSLSSASEWLAIAETSIWQDRGTDMSIWHVIAIAWRANLAFHGGFGDMTILRFARHTSYGWFSALGMFVGHFLAWLAAGVMGAGAGMLLSMPLTALDAGEVAYQALGAVGILAVIIAGWTPSNPTIYRAGLAFQSLNPAWSRERVTLFVGVITTIIACFPFVFTGLLNFLGIMALVLAPTGGIIFAEHFLLPRIGLQPGWYTRGGARVNGSAVATWLLALGATALLTWALGLHVLFLFIPAWTFAVFIYMALAMARARALPEPAASPERASGLDVNARDDVRGAAHPAAGSGSPLLATLLKITAISALVACFALAIGSYTTGDLSLFKNRMIVLTIVYFAAALALMFLSGEEGVGDE